MTLLWTCKRQAKWKPRGRTQWRSQSADFLGWVKHTMPNSISLAVNSHKGHTQNTLLPTSPHKWPSFRFLSSSQLPCLQRHSRLSGPLSPLSRASLANSFEELSGDWTNVTSSSAYFWLFCFSPLNCSEQHHFSLDLLNFAAMHSISG